MRQASSATASRVRGRRWPSTHHGRAPRTRGRRSNDLSGGRRSKKMLEFFSKKYWENVGSTFYEKCWFNFLFEKCCFNFFLKNVVTFVGKMLLQYFLKNVDRQMLATIPKNVDEKNIGSVYEKC
jgi:hypothetical protein